MSFHRLLSTVCSAVFALLPTFASGQAANDSMVVLQAPSVTVTEDDIKRYINENIPLENRMEILQKPSIYKDMAETLFILRSLAAEAEDQPGFDQVQSRWVAEIAYQRRAIAEYRALYVQALFADTDWAALAREAYLNEPEKFNAEEQVRVSHILFRIAEKPEEEVRARAEEVRQRLLDGEDFVELAKAASEDPTVSRNGGDMGYFGKGAMVPEFESAAFAMSTPGEISELVKSPFGIHIIRYDDRRGGGKKSFEAVEQELIEEIQTSMSATAWQDKIIRLRSSPEIEIDEARLQEMYEMTRVAPQQ